jgi:hypothetical protein
MSPKIDLAADDAALGETRVQAVILAYESGLVGS